MKRILALWLPNWPVQRLIADQPELAGHAIMLYEADPRYGNQVKVCSAEAAELGIRPGMPLAEAKVLKQRAPAEKRFLTPFLCDPGRDRAGLLELVDWCERFSPVVGLKQDQPDSLLMDVTGVAGLHGGEAALLREVIKQFQQRGLTVSAAIAGTAGAAWAVARWAVASPEDDSARTPWRIIPPEDEATLKTLPVAALCLNGRTMSQLERLGIERLGQLTHLPRGSLSTRFGKQLLERLDQIQGLSEEVIVVPPRPESLAVEWSFEYPTARREAIVLTLEQLLSRLSRRLVAQSRGVLQLQCRLIPQDRRSPWELTIGLYQPTTEAQHLMGLVQMQLESLRLSEPVAEIRLQATSTAVLEQRQNGLFADDSRENPRKLSLLIERLSNRLGRDQVVQVQLQPDAQPELAWQALPLTGAKSAAVVRDHPVPPVPPALQRPWLRPLHLLTPPQPIDVVGIAHSGPPALFHYQQTAHRVARHFGPERIETGWWRGESCRRDYYRVETETGQRLWLFRRLQDQQWFVHGEFD